MDPTEISMIPKATNCQKAFRQGKFRKRIHLLWQISSSSNGILNGLIAHRMQHMATLLSRVQKPLLGVVQCPTLKNPMQSTDLKTPRHPQEIRPFHAHSNGNGIQLIRHRLIKGLANDPTFIKHIEKTAAKTAGHST